MARLERRRVLDRAWQLYVQEGRDPAGLTPEILRSWRRSKEEYGIDPGLGRPIHSLSLEGLEERRRGDAVLEVASPILADFASSLELSGHVLAYLDGEGWMLTVDGDRAAVDRLGRIDFRPGANWAERSAATNAPGTALVEGKALEVFASEHYVAAWQPWTCAAAPVHAPGAPRPVGIIDITGPWEMRRRQALPLARVIARAVEERLRAAIRVRDEVVRHCFLGARESGGALVGVDAWGRVLAANGAAARWGIVEAGALSPQVRAELAAALAVASRAPEDELVIQRPDGRAVVAAPVRCGSTCVGAILRASAPREGRRAIAARSRSRALYEFDDILGRSEPLRRAVDLARTASRNELPVLLTGESGTGKELFAQAIHAASDRGAGRFVAVNCGSIPSPLVEAELFGYEAGSFTGARREGKTGRFEDADGGTLFLDEVSELSRQAQTALLRVLQEREVVRVGGSSARRVDVRVLAATNAPLEEEVEARRFRRDLYYRLNVFSIAVPALRERGDDVCLLADAFLAEAQVEVDRRGMTFAPAAMAALRACDWIGNVRELRNVVVRAVATAAGPCITAGDLSLEGGAPSRSGPSSGALRETVLASERGALVAALDACAWNFARAARHLGVSRMTFYRRLSRCGISRTDPRAPRKE